MHQLRMMMLGRWFVLGAGLVAMAALPTSAADKPPQDTPIGNQAQQERWLEGLTLLGRGRTVEAAERIRGLVSDGVADQRVRSVIGWLTDFGQVQAGRSKRLKGDYEQYVTWAKEDMAKNEWAQAIWCCGRAFEYVENEETFRGEPWLRQAVEGGLAAARRYEEQGKWYNAAFIYVRLSEIFPLDKPYRRALERCQDHIRAELLYDPASEWSTAVRDIVPDMARDAFRKIATDYLKDPAFKDAAIGGLSQLVLMTEEPKLAKVFAKLQDSSATKEFRIRIRANLAKVEGKDELTVHDLIDQFDNALTINEEVGLFPADVLVHEFVYGALQPLDKFSDMIWPSDVQEFTKHTQGKFSGVGIQIRKDPGEPILVVTPLRDSPAYAAGIRPGDLITKINGRAANKYSITRAVDEITGPVGTNVTLTLERPGLDKSFDVVLERRGITIQTIKGFQRGDQGGDWKFMIDPELKIGYVRMTNFTEQTYDELAEVIERLRNTEQMRGLVFDLRDNPGGPLKAAVDVADLFLEADKRIVSTRDRYDKLWEVSSTTQKRFADFPMIVLASRYSASASEIVAGALQVHKRALILGERTYGKGSVQQVLPLDRSRLAFLKLTTARYYLPNGRCLHKDEDSVTWGVDPDIECGLVPKERFKLSELQLKADILKGKNQGALTDEDYKHLTSYGPASQPAKQDKDNAAQSAPASTDTAPAGEKGARVKREGDGDEDDQVDEYADLQIKHEDPNSYPEIDPQLQQALLTMRVWLETDRAWPARPAEIAATPSAGAGG